MSVDLDSDELDLGALPRFQRAAFHLKQLLRLAACLGGGGVGMLLAAHYVVRRAPGMLWPPLLAVDGGALLLLAAGLHSASQIARWRGMRPHPAERDTLISRPSSPRYFTFGKLHNGECGGLEGGSGRGKGRSR